MWKITTEAFKSEGVIEKNVLVLLIATENSDPIKLGGKTNQLGCQR
jgi:hypothetical protein